MPDSMVARLFTADLEDQRDAQAEQAVQAVRAQEWRTRNALLAAELAAALAYFSAQADLQHVRERARWRKVLRREGEPAALVEAAMDGDDLDGEGFAVDTSAREPGEVAEREAMAERSLERRIRRAEICKIAKGTVLAHARA
jgi:hypothetical protein